MLGNITSGQQAIDVDDMFVDCRMKWFVYVNRKWKRKEGPETNYLGMVKEEVTTSSYNQFPGSTQAYIQKLGKLNHTPLKSSSYTPVMGAFG